jgi:hypothetical protein
MYNINPDLKHNINSDLNYKIIPDDHVYFIIDYDTRDHTCYYNYYHRELVG